MIRSTFLIRPAPGVKSGMSIPWPRKHCAAWTRARCTDGVFVATVGVGEVAATDVDLEPLDPQAASASVRKTAMTADLITRASCYEVLQWLVPSGSGANICSVLRMEKSSLQLLLAQGLSVAQIGQRFGKDPSTVSYW